MQLTVLSADRLDVFGVGGQEGVEGAGDDVFEAGVLVEELLDGEPDFAFVVAVVDVGLGDLDPGGYLVAGVQDIHAVVRVDIHDAGHDDAEEVFVILTVQDDECDHLVFEDDAEVFFHGLQALLLQVFQYLVYDCHGCKHLKSNLFPLLGGERRRIALY